MEKALPIPRVILVFFAVLIFSPPALSAKRSSTEQYLQELHTAGKERVIVRFNNQPDKSTIARYNAKLIRELKIINALVCEIDQTAIESLRRQPNVKDVVPDVVIRIPEPKMTQEEPVGRWQQPADLIIPTAYGGNATVRWNNLEAGLNSKAAWDRYNLDGTSVKIAFLDTGINYLMPNLGGGIGSGFKCLSGYDFVDNDNNPINKTLLETHGTEVAELAVGQGVNELEVIGVAYNASYYAVRVMQGDDPDTATGLLSDVMAGIEWAATEPHKADIISMSLGFYDEDYPGNVWWPYAKEDFRAVCNNAYNAGVILVASSGNKAYDHSGYPAAFTNVISVGAYGEDQTQFYYDPPNPPVLFSNGGVDIIAPGIDVRVVDPDNSAYLVTGTSFATPHVAGLLALQLQYTWQNNLQPNNGYLWEVTKHSAVDMPLILDPNNPGAPDPYSYKGKGKVWAAGTDINDANVGSIDLMALDWPVDYGFQFHDYAFMDGNRPVYHLGSDVNETIILTNITDILGNTTETIENLKVTATQVYYGEPNEPNLPGNSVKVFPTISQLEPNEANSITLSYIYTIPPQTTAGLKKTKIQFEFNFMGNSRVIKVTYNEPDSFWYAAIPADLDLSNTVDFADYCRFSNQWQQAGCNASNNWCDRADINRSGTVDRLDLSILADNWLRGE